MRKQPISGAKAVIHGEEVTVYVQPGGCVEITMAGEMMHFCAWSEVVELVARIRTPGGAMRESSVEYWKKRAELAEDFQNSVIAAHAKRAEAHAGKAEADQKVQAHNLAELIRAAKCSLCSEPYGLEAVDAAADLIDPEVNG